MIRIYMGDVHGDFALAGEVYDHAVKHFLDGQVPDEIVQAGDYGFGLRGVEMWTDAHNELYPLPGRKIFIDGNHENHAYLWGMEQLYKNSALDRSASVQMNAIRTLTDQAFKGWIYMSRGTVKDRTCYLGGAASPDKDVRIARSMALYEGEVKPHIWSEYEDLDAGSVDRLFQLYPDCLPFDTVVSHTFPSICDLTWACNPHYGLNDRKDELSRVQLQRVYDRYKEGVRLWVGGHWHRGRVWREGDTRFVLLNTVSSLPKRDWAHLNECFYIEER